ncbi:CoA transferase [Streptomyces sp. NPDC002787]
MSEAQTELRLWAASGAMALTGRRDGPPAASPGRPATAVAEALRRIQAVHPQAPLPDIRILGERAAATGMSRNAPWSCGGAFRVLPTRDGHVGLSLPRAEDMDMMPALVAGPVTGDPWTTVEHWAVGTTTADAVERARLLDLACAPVTARPTPVVRPAALVSPLGTRALNDRPLVVDLSSLWAGPLCAHLLSLCGAEVVKVEGSHRLDGARGGPAVFYDLLHAGHRSVTVAFDAPSDLRRLRVLLASADLVIEGSRARALRRRGISAEDIVAAGTNWLSITAYGRDEDLIGFGDDVAAGAGLVTPERFPCGDALADPLTGVTAAACAVEALDARETVLMDVSMHAVAAAAAQGATAPHEVVRRRGTWWVDCASGAFAVARPSMRQPSGRAPAAGRHNHDVLWTTT